MDAFSPEERTELKRICEEHKAGNSAAEFIDDIVADTIKVLADLEAAEAQREALLRMMMYTYLPPNPEEVLERAMQKDAPWNAVCRVCGCSWFRPCPGGCGWAEADLCSACVGKSAQE